MSDDAGRNGRPAHGRLCADRSASPLPEIPPQQRHTASEYYEKEVDRKQITLIIGFDACDAKNENDKWALRAAAGLLNGTGGLSGWLPVELRSKRDLVYVVWAGANSQQYGGHFSITTQCEPDDADTVKAIIIGQIERLRTGDFDEKDLTNITESIAEQFIMARQAQSSLVNAACLDELYGFGFNYSDMFPEKIRAVTKSDVVRVANEYLKNPTTIVLRPKGPAE